MQEQILRPFQDVRQHQSTALEEALTKTIRELNNIVRLDDYHRHGHDPDNLQSALGPFASAHLDLGSLSQVLGSGTRSRAMSAERLERIQGLLATLTQIKATCHAADSESTFVDLSEDEAEIRELAEGHFNRMATVFRALRIAQLEARAKYDTAVHDAEFADFDWRQLGPAELRLCSPFLVVGNIDGDNGACLRKMMALLESRVPIKIAALRTSLRKAYSSTADTSVPAAMSIEMLSLAMRGVYFLQTCVAATDFYRRLFDGLTAPRPGVISLLCHRPDEDMEALKARSHRAVRSRSCVMCSYDPDRSLRFGNCFDLTGNPAPEALWSIDTLEGQDATGQSITIEEAFTLAHYAANEAEFADEFSDPPAEADKLTRLIDYLEFTRRQRVGKLPYISLREPDGGIVRKVVSPLVALQCTDRLHLWRTLQEITGLDNPHVQTTRIALKHEFGVQQQALLESVRRDLEKAATRREQVSVANTVRKLVSHLTGVDSSQINLDVLLPSPPSTPTTSD